MNLKAFMKAIRFACLPTLSLLILLFFAFFSISDTIDFISSSHGGAVTLRILAVVGEIVLVYIMYQKYLKEEIIKGNYGDKNGKHIGYASHIYKLSHNWSSDDNYEMYNTESEDIKVIKRIKSDF